ncbi:MAG: ParB/RepB/Spo0J family partition protein [Candidatus Omnitrophota bacterium]|nr:ParB/RepB/Spo0J family partition protein [Candidatus Omnitrophota bacterium]
MEHRALGKGLSALIPERASLPEEFSAQGKAVQTIKTEKIKDNPFQPRTSYPQEKLEELVASIKEKGVLQPILVRESSDGNFEVVAGERRLRAARALQLTEVPAVVRNVSDSEALVLALVENIQREELNALEEAQAFQRLISEFHLSQEDVARSVGKDRSTVSNTLRLLNLPEEIQQSLLSDEITMGHARALLAVSDGEEQKQIFELLRTKKLSVRELENLIKTGLRHPARRKKTNPADRNHDLVALEEDLQQVLGTKVRIQPQKKRGKIVIEYYSLDDLDRVLSIIKGQP